MWVLVRNLSSSIHPLEIAFWGSVFGLVTFLPTFFEIRTQNLIRNVPVHIFPGLYLTEVRFWHGFVH